MKLKKILATLDGLDAALHILYVKQADGKFHLQLEDDDGEELKRAKEHEKGLRIIAEQERDQARTDLTTAQSTITTLQGQANQGVQELRATLTAEWQKRLDDQKAESDAKIAGLYKIIKKVFIHDVAHGIAKDIAIDEGAAELLTDFLARRLSVEIVNGEPLTRVLQADGKPSSLTPDELKAEYLANEKYSGIMRASGASGSGATKGEKPGGGASKKLDDLSDEERNKMSKDDPVGFQRLVDEKKASLGQR